MLIETTYTNRDDEQLINDLIGKPYSLFQSIRMGGTGSGRMIIESVSPNMTQYMNTYEDITYSSIELRPGGILLHINRNLRTFTWAIPFYHLVLYKTDGRSIHAQGKFVKFKNDKRLKQNKKFFDKLLAAKTKHEFIYAFQ